MVSVWEKAHWMCQVGIRKTSVVAVEVSKEAWLASKPKHMDSFGMSLEGCPFTGQVVLGIQVT